MAKSKILAASHMVPLVRAFEQSEGDVLELGTGYFSTLLLHWLCELSGRKLVSYETVEKWAERAKKNWANERHEVHHVTDLDAVNLTDRHWGLVLIDHAPHSRRKIDALRLKDNADFLVLHDSEPKEDRLYQYSSIYGDFKHVYQYTKIVPWTAIISNFKEFRP